MRYIITLRNVLLFCMRLYTNHESKYYSRINLNTSKNVQQRSGEYNKLAFYF